MPTFFSRAVPKQKAPPSGSCVIVNMVEIPISRKPQDTQEKKSKETSKDMGKEQDICMFY